MTTSILQYFFVGTWSTHSKFAPPAAEMMEMGPLESAEVGWRKSYYRTEHWAGPLTSSIPFQYVFQKMEQVLYWCSMLSMLVMKVTQPFNNWLGGIDQNRFKKGLQKSLHLFIQRGINLTVNPRNGEEKKPFNSTNSCRLKPQDWRIWSSSSLKYFLVWWVGQGSRLRCDLQPVVVSGRLIYHKKSDKNITGIKKTNGHIIQE